MSLPVMFKTNFDLLDLRDEDQDLDQDPESGESGGAFTSLVADVVFLDKRTKLVKGFGPSSVRLSVFIIPLSVIDRCRGGGVLDNQSGPVSEHQHHVHSMSESTCTSRTGSQHQVHMCMTSSCVKSPVLHDLERATLQVNSSMFSSTPCFVAVW